MLSRRWELLSSADVLHSSERAEETGKDTRRSGRNSAAARAGSLASCRENSAPTAFLGAPGSRSWKPSPVSWATRWAGNRSRSTSRAGRMPGLWKSGPQGPRRAPLARDHAGGRGPEATLRQLPPPSAGFLPPGIKPWALTAPASARARRKIVHAGVNSASHQQASYDLAGMSDLDVRPRPVERPVKSIGGTRRSSCIRASRSAVGWSRGRPRT